MSGLDTRRLNDVAEIRRLLQEAYDHYFANSDGYCKSAEGSISLHLGNYWENADGRAEVGVTVYSYVLGPERIHDFRTTAEALAAVRVWHQEEMATTYCPTCRDVVPDGDPEGWHEGCAR